MTESTAQLIQRLGQGFVPTPPRALDRRISSALIVGALAAFALMGLFLGVRPDLAAAAGGWILWIKLGYAAALIAGGYLLSIEAARPAARGGWRIAMVLVPVLLIATAGMLRTATLPAAQRGVEWLGNSAVWCPWLISALSLPCLLALTLVMRRAAPTRLRWAGLCAGLLAGAISMLIYSLHCPEEGLAFVATWYTLGLCVPAALGAAIGPRLLRW